MGAGGSVMDSATNLPAMPRIVVLGTGLGGTLVAFEISHAVRGRATVGIISRIDGQKLADVIASL
jgi:NADH dehydrogenase FAD-containing subunit